MKTRFIDFEGIHGSGKSSCAWNLYNNLNEQGKDVNVYFEYDLDNAKESPCDLKFLAVLKKSELDFILEKFKEHRERIMSSIKQYGKYYCIFFAAFKDVPELFDELQEYEAYEGRLDADDFIQLVKGRIQHFVNIALENECIYVFESVIFQHILNELVRFSDCTSEYIVDSILEIEKILRPLNPMIFYLKPYDLKAQIDKVAKERLSDNYELYPDWIDWMVEYVKKSKYGERNHIKNRVDLMKYFMYRKEIEESAFKSLTMNKQEIIVEHIDYEAENHFIYKEVVMHI
ncbi:hypothetical protein [Inconstantimicrobium mannanitabidum]|uniref:Uncharacterized protein n=1 Tax=Inconstantimicrobium mannanitabidum TaxID=1604901 RepID=A0ACB5REC0_9CLOT|nr:hypothetical protein [Clostridium sp. TW13]GKX67127.1 hypothetical protein rsdtw13_23850 [Clostridium sp. TW13]